MSELETEDVLITVLLANQPPYSWLRYNGIVFLTHRTRVWRRGSILTPRLLEPHTSSFISSGDETAGRCADWYLCLLTHAAAQSRPLLPPLCALGNWEGTTEALRMGGGVWAPLDALLSNRCSLGCFLHFSFLFLVVLLSAVCYSTIAPSRNPGMDIIHFEKFKNISNCP